MHVAAAANPQVDEWSPLDGLGNLRIASRRNGLGGLGQHDACREAHVVQVKHRWWIRLGTVMEPKLTDVREVYFGPCFLEIESRGMRAFRHRIVPEVVGFPGAILESHSQPDRFTRIKEVEA